MNLEEELDKLRRDLDRRTAEIRRQSEAALQGINDRRYTYESILSPVNHFDAAPGQRPSLVQLKRSDDLEEEAKTRIGTFEQIYYSTYIRETGMPLYGYDDLDYAALVNQLASALEIELNHTVYQFVRKLNGIGMPDYFDEKYGKAPQKITITKQGIKPVTIDIAEATCYCLLSRIRPFLEEENCFTKLKEKIPGTIDALIDFLRPGGIFLSARNEAAHTGFISQKQFLDFYEDYSTFFNGNIDVLLELKRDLKQKGRERTEEARDEWPATESYSQAIGRYRMSPDRKRGVIFTDTAKIARKYSAGQTQVQQSIAWYIGQCAQCGIDYILCDAANILPDGSTWPDYLSLLDGFCHEHGIDGQSPAGLFIIGGHDVIPMPQIHNPTSLPIKEMWEQDLKERDLDADMLYAYDGQYVQTDEFRNLKLILLIGQKPRFFVGRLPMEDGCIETDLTDDLQGYFRRAIAAYRPGTDQEGNSKDCGIRIETPVFTTCQTACMVAGAITNMLPLVRLEEIPGYIYNGMIVSPDFAETEYTPQTSYCRGIQSRADMLLFVLHGHWNASLPYYMGESNNQQYPRAISPELMRTCNAQVIAGIACWGARFIGYSREESALLSAIYNQTLLFFGSSRSAVGGFDSGIAKNNRTHYAETMLKYYLQYLMQGYDAGESLMYAKFKYFNQYHNKDMKEAAVMTILEFNLFGDPLLHLCPMLQKERISNICIMTESESENKTYRQLYGCQNRNIMTLREELQNLVDNNLRRIQSIIEEYLYKYYDVEPRTLYSAHRWITDSGKSGYTLRYRGISDEIISDTLVETDDDGGIINILKTY